MLRYKHWLTKKGWWDDAQENELYAQYREEILSQMKEAEKRPINNIDDIITDVFDEPSPILESQLADLKRHIEKYPTAYPKTSGRLDS